MERNTVSERIVQIIQKAYSDTPPDPYASAEAEALLDQFYGMEIFNEEVLIFSEYPEPDYEWSSTRVELLEDDVEEGRYQELAEGATLTPEEEPIFREAADREAQERLQYAWSAHIYRLAAPPESGEERVVFFVWTGNVSSQYADTRSCGGPFRDIIEAVQFILDIEGEPDTVLEEVDFPERPRLNDWLAARNLTF